MPCPLCGALLERVTFDDLPPEVAGIARGTGAAVVYHCPRCDAWMGK